MSLYHQRGKKKNPDLSNRPVKPSQRSTSNPPSSASRASTVAPPIPSERTHDGFFTRILKTNPSSSFIITKIFWRPQKSVRNVARKSSRAKRVARRRARVQIVPASRKNYFLARFARASRTPSVRSLPRPPHFDKKFAHIYSQKKLCINLTHHFFLTVRGEHRGRRRALRVRHRRHNGVCVLSGRRRRLRFQVAFERLLVKGFRERHDG